MVEVGVADVPAEGFGGFGEVGSLAEFVEEIGVSGLSAARAKAFSGIWG